MINNLAHSIVNIRVKNKSRLKKEEEEEEKGLEKQV